MKRWWFTYLHLAGIVSAETAREARVKAIAEIEKKLCRKISHKKVAVGEYFQFRGIERSI